MKLTRRVLHRLIGGVLMFIVGNGLGYMTRTYECRNDRVRVYVAAPGYEASAGQLPEKLYALQVTRCTLPEQWGGDREPLEGYP